jgi:glucose/arabinose dehydrogenase
MSPGAAAIPVANAMGRARLMPPGTIMKTRAWTVAIVTELGGGGGILSASREWFADGWSLPSGAALPLMVVVVYTVSPPRTACRR